MGVCYEHLSYVDRLSIDEGRRVGLSLRAIARKLGRAPSTISREVRRMGPHIPGYVPAHALHLALRRRSESRRGRHKLLPGSPTGCRVRSAMNTVDYEHSATLDGHRA